MIRRAVILAGGEGTRLRPVTLEIPKPLIPVQGVPIASWLVRLFASHGVEEVTVIYPTRWKRAFESWAQGIHPTCVSLFEEREPMGTLGALVHEISHGEDPLFVTNGDELKGLDLSTLSSAHLEPSSQLEEGIATIALVRVANPSEYGVAEVVDKKIVRFHEKPQNPPSNLINSGLYVVDPVLFSEMDRSKRFLMFEKDLFPQLAEQGRLHGCPLNGPWYDCGTMERWERAIREWSG